MNKDQIKETISDVSFKLAMVGIYMKIPNDRLDEPVSDEEFNVVRTFGDLALALGKFSEAVDQLPDEES